MRRGWSLRPRQWLALILIASVLSRLGLAIYLGQDMSEIRGGTFDQITYDALAQRVVDGHGFSFAEDYWPYTRANEPTAFWSYLYTLFLAAIYSLAGHQPLLARLVQALLVGVLMPWLTYRIGRRAFNQRVALLAAAASAGYLYFILYGASLMTEALYIAGILWVIDVAMRLAAAPWLGWRQGLELGLAVGLTLLLRQVFVVFVPVLGLWLLGVAWRRGRLRAAGLALAVAAALVLLLLSPFIVRNYRVFGRLSMPNTNVGINFFWSNHPIYGTRFEPVLSPERGVSYQELIPVELRNLNEAQLDRALLQRGIEIVLEDPGRYLRLSLSRIPVYFLFWPTAASTTVSNLSRVLSFGIALPFMVAGLTLAVRQLVGRLRAGNDDAADLRPAYWLLMFLFMAVYSAVHLASWANVRYRLPVDAFLLIFAAYALDRLLVWWRQRLFAARSASADTA